MFLIPTLYLKGSFNGWGLDTPFTQVGERQFAVNLVLSADCHHFKITDLDGSQQWTLTGDAIKTTAVNENQSLNLIATQGIGNDLVFTPKQTARFTLSLDLANQFEPKFTLTQTITNQLASRERFSEVLFASSADEPQPMAKLDSAAMQALFAKLTIGSTESFPFVFGDSLDGYYAGQSHQLIEAGRYRHHQGWYLGGAASFVNGKLNDKTEPCQARLQAYGIEHEFANGSTELLSIFSGKRMLCLSLNSSKAASLSFLPELNLGVDDCEIEKQDNTVVISVKPECSSAEAPRFIAISSEQTLVVDELREPLFAALPATVSNVQLLFKTLRETNRFTLYFAFAQDKQTALANAQHAARCQGLLQHQQQTYQYLTHNYLWTSDSEYSQAVMWARLASRSLVNREFGTGIWAGLPWFKDCWGRDTFIALSGACLVNGQWQDAKNIIKDFALMQMQDKQNVNYGRIPNRVTSKTNIIYNTTDGTPWMIREVMEYINYSGDFEFAAEIYPVVKRFIDGVVKNYLDQDGLMLHRDPDTWMDAKINGEIPWSPRGPKANDIQALWFESLNIAARLAQWNNDEKFAERCLKLGKKVQASFMAKFWQPDSLRLADHLQPQDKADFSIRPNQLMTLTIPYVKSLISKDIGQYIVKNAVQNLLFPWGICSLDQQDKDFHPYHDNRQEYHKDAAYHNGTIWGWNAGFTVSALVQYEQQELAYQLTKNLAKQILAQGHRGTMSENLDAFQHDISNLVESGTYSQAWSVSEFARNAQQDYLGFAPKLSQNKIKLTPRIPADWQYFKAHLPFDNNLLYVEMKKQGDTISYVFEAQKPAPDITLQFQLTLANNCIRMLQPLAEKQQLKFSLSSGELIYSDNDVLLCKKVPEHFAALADLGFAKPKFSANFAALSEPNYLRSQRLQQSLSAARD